MPKKNSGMWYEVHPTPVKGEQSGGQASDYAPE